MNTARDIVTHASSPDIMPALACAIASPAPSASGASFPCATDTGPRGEGRVAEMVLRLARRGRRFA